MHKWRLAAIAAIAMVSSLPANAQDGGGIAVCLAGCAKVDMACQDRCIPASRITAPTHACITNCRRKAKDPDLLVNLKACIGHCLEAKELTH